MDILQKYNEENPEVALKSPRWESFEECSFLACMVMKWSGGRVQNERQANIILLIFSVIFLGIALVITINPFVGTQPLPAGEIIYNPGQPPRLSPTIAP